MTSSTWAELTATLSPGDLALFEAYRAACLELPGVQERVHATEVQFAVDRIFSSGYMKSHHLEIIINLPRTASSPHLRAAFRTTKSIITHRFTIDSEEELATVRDLIREARDSQGS